MELLAPAGSYGALVAAVEAGADAVYVGGKQFSARQSADNFDDRELEKAVEYCHIRDRKLYVAVNTLISDAEMAEALDFVFFLQNIGVDAFIIQDLGLLHVIRTVFPSLRLHASTQMTAHNVPGVEFLRQQGILRVVLARETGLREIAAIHSAVPDIELEVFVHGALCYSFSGQCLFSSVVGGRSGNRGRCAQPCRLPYSLLSAQSGERISAPGDYLLSPADLCLIEHLWELEDAGVTSLKIEGRMKRPEYVAIVTSVYREALAAGPDPSQEMVGEWRRRLLAAFNRTFSSGYLYGIDREWLSAKRPNNRGTLVGRVQSVEAEHAVIALKDCLACGDGIEFWSARGENKATVVDSMYDDGVPVAAASPPARVEIEVPRGVRPGDRVFKTSDSQLIQEARCLMAENRPQGRRPVTMRVEAFPGLPLRVVVTDLRSEERCEAVSADVLSQAQRRATTRDEVLEKMGELGDTPFRLEEVDIRLGDGVMVPFSWLKETRRRAIAQMQDRLLEERRRPAVGEEEYRRQMERVAIRPGRPAGRNAPVLTVATNSADKARAALEAGADEVYLLLAGTRQGTGIRPADPSAIRSGKSAGQKLIAGLPRILLPGEKIMADLEPFDGILVSNLGWLEAARGKTAIGDYALNVFNGRAVLFLVEQGLSRICLSVELTLKQMGAIARGFPGKTEAVVHGDIPLMVSRYCLPGGINDPGYGEGCRGFCRHKDLVLSDRRNYRFPIQTDRYCRMYVYNSRTLCAIEEMKPLMEAGVGSLRLDLHLGDAWEVQRTVGVYREALDLLLRGKTPDYEGLRNRLGTLSKSEFTKLHYYRGVME